MFTKKIMQLETSEGRATRTTRYKRAEVAHNSQTWRWNLKTGNWNWSS